MPPTPPTDPAAQDGGALVPMGTRSQDVFTDDGHLPRILVVDSDAAVRASLVQSFTNLGYVVVESGDGRQALVELSERPPHVLVMDLALTSVGGLDLLRTMQAHKLAEGCRVVVHSAQAQAIHVQRARSLGAHRFLDRRPGDNTPVVDAVHEQLGELGFNLVQEPAPAPAANRSGLRAAFGSGGGPPGTVPKLDYR